MFIKFLSDKEHHGNSVVIPQTYQAKRLFDVNIQRLNEYHRTSRVFLDDRNLIKRLIKVIDVSGSRNIYDYVDTVRDRVGTLSRLFHLSSSVNVGSVHHGEFLNKNTTEMIVLHGEYFDMEDAIKNWETLEPVTFLDHPHTSISLALPDGNHPEHTAGSATIAINLPMLALQYRLWAQRELTKDTPLLLSTFVVGYPLNNAIRSHLDIAIFNRLFNMMSNNKSLNKTHIKATPIHMPDFTDTIDNILTAYVSVILRRRMTFFELLYSIPTFATQSFMTRAKLPDIPMTDQVCWALYGATIKKLVWLFRIDDRLKLALNRDSYNEARWITRRLDNDKVLQRGYPEDLFTMLTEVREFLDLQM